MPTIVTAGDTVRLKVAFKDWDGLPVDPSDITFTVYDEAMGAQGTPVSIGAANKVSTGVYQYDYTTPYMPGTYLAEFIGTLDGDEVAVRRLRIEAKLVAS
jgi:uncharacterized protein YfaS (alpha-2-macroglobulin family)